MLCTFFVMLHVFLVTLHVGFIGIYHVPRYSAVITVRYHAEVDKLIIEVRLIELENYGV